MKLVLLVATVVFSLLTPPGWSATNVSNVMRAAQPASVPSFTDPLQFMGVLEQGFGVQDLANLRVGSRAEQLEALKRKGVTITSDPEDVLKEDALAYLNAFFSVFPPRSPVRVSSGRRDGIQLAWTENGTIVLNRTITTRLPNLQLMQARGAVLREAQGENHGRGFTVTFNNELFFQLTRLLLSREDLIGVIEKRFRLEVSDLERNDQRFAKDELVFILKQLIDLPAYATSNWGLKRLRRTADGVDLPGNASAIYSGVNETIVFADRAFQPDRAIDVGGEGAILHELGHALWKNIPTKFKTAFAEISWSRATSGGASAGWSVREWTPKRGVAPGDQAPFVTGYAATSVEEDFAEHFAFYINRPKDLQRRAEKKFQWLQANLFPDTSYFEETADNARVAVSENRPDADAPKFTCVGVECVHFSIEKTGPFAASMTVEVSGVIDDVSGVKSIEFELLRFDRPGARQNPATPRIRASLFANHIQDRTKGIFKAILPVNLKEAPGGPYRVISARLRDRAENERVVQLEGPELIVPDSETRQRVDPPELWLDPKAAVKNLRITDIRAEGNETIFYVQGPLGAFTEKEFAGSLVFVFLAEKNQINSSFSAASTGKSFAARTDGTFRVGPFVMPKNLPADRYLLRAVRVFTDITERYNSKDFSYNVDGDHLAIAHSGLDAKVQPIELAVQDLNLTAEGKSEETRIRVRLPVSGVSPGSRSLGWFKVQTPSGKVLQADFSESQIKSAADGSRYLDLELRLPEHHEGGLYELRELMVWEGAIPSTLEPGAQMPFDLQNFKNRQEKFVQRGINKTVQINPDVRVN